MDIREKIRLINQLKSQAEILRPQKAWDQAFLEKIKVEFTYTSNKIEGNTITYGQTVKLLKEMVTPKNATTGEVLDIVNHQLALDIVFRNYHQREISEESIQELHRALMRNIEQWSDDGLYSPGNYKAFENVTVRANGKIHRYKDPGEVSQAMAQLLADTNRRMDHADLNVLNNHPLFIATYFHQQFLNVIHPFADGNGRIGRIFTNLILIKSGFPPLFITEVNRTEYLDSFERSESNSEVMLHYLADRLIESLNLKIDFLSQKDASEGT